MVSLIGFKKQYDMHRCFSVKIFFRVLFAIISIISLMGYIIYKPALKQQPITYQIIDKVKQGGRGKYYVLSVSYKQTVYKVDITRKMYNEIDRGKFPALYYSQTYNKIVSEWTIEVFMRVFVLFLILALITFIPLPAGARRND